jgi:hypothetical protein
MQLLSPCASAISVSFHFKHPVLAGKVSNQDIAEVGLEVAQAALGQALGHVVATGAATILTSLSRIETVDLHDAPRPARLHPQEQRMRRPRRGSAPVIERGATDEDLPLAARQPFSSSSNVRQRACQKRSRRSSTALVQLCSDRGILPEDDRELPLPGHLCTSPPDTRTGAPGLENYYPEAARRHPEASGHIPKRSRRAPSGGKLAFCVSHEGDSDRHVKRGMSIPLGGLDVHKAGGSPGCPLTAGPLMPKARGKRVTQQRRHLPGTSPSKQAPRAPARCSSRECRKAMGCHNEAVEPSRKKQRQSAQAVIPSSLCVSCALRTIASSQQRHVANTMCAPGSVQQHNEFLCSTADRNDSELGAGA